MSLILSIRACNILILPQLFSFACEVSLFGAANSKEHSRIQWLAKLTIVSWILADARARPKILWITNQWLHKLQSTALKVNKQLSLRAASPWCVPACETTILGHKVRNSVPHSLYLLGRAHSRVAPFVLFALLLVIFCVLQNDKQFCSRFSAVTGLL